VEDKDIISNPPSVEDKVISSNILSEEEKANPSTPPSVEERDTSTNFPSVKEKANSSKPSGGEDRAFSSILPTEDNNDTTTNPPSVEDKVVASNAEIVEETAFSSNPPTMENKVISSSEDKDLTSNQKEKATPFNAPNDDDNDTCMKDKEDITRTSQQSVQVNLASNSPSVEVNIVSNPSINKANTDNSSAGMVTMTRPENQEQLHNPDKEDDFRPNTAIHDDRTINLNEISNETSNINQETCDNQLTTQHDNIETIDKVSQPVSSHNMEQIVDNQANESSYKETEDIEDDGESEDEKEWSDHTDRTLTIANLSNVDDSSNL